MILTTPNVVQLTIRELNIDFKFLAGAAEPRRPAAADGRPLGGQRRLSGGPNAAWAAAAVSLSATVTNTALPTSTT